MGFMIGGMGLAAFFILMLIGMPIGLGFGLVGFVGISLLGGLKSALTVLGSTTYQTASQFTFVTVPLFVLMGQFAFHSGISEDLYQAAYKWAGRLPGGLAHATVLACGGFAACTGSGIAAAATMATISFPEMEKADYDQRLSTGCIAAGGILGGLIPPSIFFIIYGGFTSTSIGKLFIAGIFPGLMIIGLFLMIIQVMCTVNPQIGPRGPSFPWRERLTSLRGVWGALIVALLIIGGLYIGIFSPTEAGAIGAFGTFIIALLKGRLTKANLTAALVESTRITCFVLTIVIGALIFNVFLVMTGLASLVSNWATGLTASPYVVLALILLLYLPLGTVMEEMGMILLTIPIYFPIITELGIDPILFGVLLEITTGMGAISPPVGMTMYVVHGVTKVPLGKVFAGCLPFLLALAVSQVLLLLFPQIALFLPSASG